VPALKWVFSNLAHQKMMLTQPPALHTEAGKDCCLIETNGQTENSNRGFSSLDILKAWRIRSEWSLELRCSHFFRTPLSAQFV
jgi:hypothetical protein